MCILCKASGCLSWYSLILVMFNVQPHVSLRLPRLDCHQPGVVLKDLHGKQALLIIHSTTHYQEAHTQLSRGLNMERFLQAMTPLGIKTPMSKATFRVAAASSVLSTSCSLRLTPLAPFLQNELSQALCNDLKLKLCLYHHFNYQPPLFRQSNAALL